MTIGILSSQESVCTLGELPVEINETSGLLFYNGHLITHNDSGNSTELFELDTLSLSIRRRVTITNAQNTDWEDLAQDDNYFYIGDFGNNLGNRTDLAVYRVSKSIYAESDQVRAEAIAFSLEDQNTFESDNSSDWDIEAMFVMGDHLVLLTKQWTSMGTVAYLVPKIPGIHSAKRLDSYPIAGLVTSASYNLESGLLYILGYSSRLESFVYRIGQVSESGIFNGTVEKLASHFGFAQVEAIAAVTADAYLVTSEAFFRETPEVNFPATLYSLKTADEPLSSGESPLDTPDGTNELVLFHPAMEATLSYLIPQRKTLVARAVFDTMGRQVAFESGVGLDGNSLDLSFLAKGIYYITFYFEDGKTTRAFANY